MHAALKRQQCVTLSSVTGSLAWLALFAIFETQIRLLFTNAVFSSGLNMVVSSTQRYSTVTEVLTLARVFSLRL